MRQLAMICLLGVMAVHGLIALAAAIATGNDPIDVFACIAGVFGVPVSLILVVLEIFIIGYLAKTWPRRRDDKRYRFVIWVMGWFVFNGIAVLALSRSAVLCTV
ncbi:MAG: hypothetical protein AAGC71_14075 [Pseudomonadota bacterium]